MFLEKDGVKGSYPNTNYADPKKTPHIKKVIDMSNPPASGYIDYEFGTIFDKDGNVVGKDAGAA